jgi:hypothetical protein
MKSLIRILSLVTCVAVLAVTPLAHAAVYSVSGSFWEVPAYTNVPVAGSAVYSTAPTATFTVSNTSVNNIFNFDSRLGAADYTLLGFLGSGGDTVSLSGHGSDLLNTPAGCNGDTPCTVDSLFQFTGSTTLTPGTYNFAHDDGVLLYLDSTLVFNVGGPTSPTNTNFVVCAVAGVGCDAVAGSYSFTLDYGEVAGNPAVLVTNLPLAASTPEPGSIVLLGSGLVAAAGMIRRRILA